jgi:hypothetical protein
MQEVQRMARRIALKHRKILLSRGEFEILLSQGEFFGVCLPYTAQRVNYFTNTLLHVVLTKKWLVQ